MEVYLPKSANKAEVRFIGVSAHKDDIEMLAFDGIIRSLKGEGGFAAVVLTDGGACPRANGYQDVSDADMAQLRTAEQKRAAERGGYSGLYLFEKTSDEIKKKTEETVKALADIFIEYPNADALYIHSPFDRHPTHVAACLTALEAIKLLPDEVKPARVYGCEVWRDLDWLPSRRKVVFDLSGFDNFAAELMGCFQSQNAVKRYDRAALARRIANATFSESHKGDTATAAGYAVDLTELTRQGSDAKQFVLRVIDEFRDEILQNLKTV